uniref:Conserved oligomeric Golgi complex subunit 7 n=1 Tax=Globisporangium ultimum (strain ATCC 200006 / CBS 805.95 / DAOM BR144) TaxID=431595 RepID=K3WFF3_GLOUD
MLEVQEELFCADGFDCYAWVEEALIESSGRVGELAPLVPQLALLSQSLTRSVHATLHQLTVTGPQLQSQVEALQTAMLPLKAQLDTVVAHVGDSDASASWSTSHRKKEDARALQHLVTLHDAKQKLQACSQALVEAAKWEKNVRACFAAVEEPDVGTASLPSKEDGALSLADRVREMHTSLEVLHEMPGADDRHATMQTLCAQIEARLTPKLIAYLREEHVPVTRVQTCLAIFTSIHRDAIVRDEYCKGRPAHVHRVWFAYSSENDDASSAESFADWLEGFYSDVYVMLQRESHHIREIFGTESVAKVLVVLLQSTFSSIRASFQDRLTTSSASSSDTMTTLLRSFQSSTAFATQVVQLLRSLEAGSSASPLANGEKQPVDVGDSVLASIFEPYRVFFQEYASYASAALTQDLLALVPRFAVLLDPSISATSGLDDNEDDILDDHGEGALDEFAQRLEDASKDVWALVDESMKQCYTFSAGAAFPEAVDAVAKAVHEFARALVATIPSIRHFCNLPGAKSGNASGSLGTSGAPDWSKFHAALALLKACGTLEQDLCAMEIRVKARVGEQLSQFLQADADHDRHTTAALSSSPRSSRKMKERKFDANVVFALADLVDTTKLVAAVATTWLRDDTTRCNAFVQFVHECHDSFDSFSSSSLLEAATSMNAVLFADAQMALREWIREVQLLTFDTVFLPIARLLEHVPKNENWTKTTDASLGDLPSFSTLPQEYITMVADLLLSLLPQLEQFAESSSLQKASTASYGLETVCVVSQWQRLGAILSLSEHEMASCVSTFAAPTATQQGLDAMDPSTTANDFVDLWTSAVASGTLATLLCAICAIPSLSDRGAKQLSADLGYFHNVLSAVGGGDMPTNALVDDLRHVLDLPLADHAQHADMLAQDGSEQHDAASAQVLAKLNASLVAKRQRAGNAANYNGPKQQQETPASSTSQYY